jgi:hypothetical protein
MRFVSMPKKGERAEGFSRAAIYRLMKKTPAIIRKNGKTSLVDTHELRRVAEALPVADSNAALK